MVTYGRLNRECTDLPCPLCSYMQGAPKAFMQWSWCCASSTNTGFLLLKKENQKKQQLVTTDKRIMKVFIYFFVKAITQWSWCCVSSTNTGFLYGQKKKQQLVTTCFWLQPSCFYHNHPIRCNETFDLLALKVAYQPSLSTLYITHNSKSLTSWIRKHDTH